RACGTQLVIEKEASAVAANARVERMRREDAGPEGDVVDVETRGVAARFVEDVREVGDGEGAGGERLTGVARASDDHIDAVVESGQKHFDPVGRRLAIAVEQRDDRASRRRRAG